MFIRNSVLCLYLTSNIQCHRSYSALRSKKVDHIFERTCVHVIPSSWKIKHGDGIFLLGSCFSDNISAKLTSSRFHVISNPFGTIYNPLSISRSIESITQSRHYQITDLVEDATEPGVFHSWDHHSSFSGTDAASVVNLINSKVTEASTFLRNASALFLTIGTNQVHMLKNTDREVANCHKQPSSLFVTRRMTVSECVLSLSSAIATCRELNPKLQVVLTVSPVRHTRGGGVVQNSLGKSTLICAAHELAQTMPFVSYFPAYELMMDDLRDYRWYAEDLVHPSSQAQDYIYSHFCNCYFASETLAVCDEVAAVANALRHRPIVQSNAYRKHLQHTLDKMLYLQGAYQFLNFEDEIAGVIAYITQFDNII